MRIELCHFTPVVQHRRPRQERSCARAVGRRPVRIVNVSKGLMNHARGQMSVRDTFEHGCRRSFGTHTHCRHLVYAHRTQSVASRRTPPSAISESQAAHSNSIRRGRSRVWSLSRPGSIADPHRRVRALRVPDLPANVTAPVRRGIDLLARRANAIGATERTRARWRRC